MSVTRLMDRNNVTGVVEKYLQPNLGGKIFFRAFHWYHFFCLNVLWQIIVCRIQWAKRTNPFILV